MIALCVASYTINKNQGALVISLIKFFLVRGISLVRQ